MLACVITDRSMKKPNLYLPIHILSGSEKKVGRLVGETFNVKPCREKNKEKFSQNRHQPTATCLQIILSNKLS